MLNDVGQSMNRTIHSMNGIFDQQIDVQGFVRSQFFHGYTIVTRIISFTTHVKSSKFQLFFLN